MTSVMDNVRANDRTTTRASDMPSLHALTPAARRLWRATTRSDGSAPVRFDSRAGVLWAIVIGFDFAWLSNPVVFWPFDTVLRLSAGITLFATILTPGRDRIRVPWSVVAVLAFGFLSTIWGEPHRHTFEFTLLYVVMAAVALAIVLSVDARTIANGVIFGGVLVVVGSIYAYETAMPGSAAAPNEGYLAGVGMNRNVLSYTMILALPFALSFVPRAWAGRLLWVAGTGTILGGLYLTQSATGFVAAVMLTGAALVMGVKDRFVARSADPVHRVSWWLRLAPVATLVIAGLVLVVLVKSTGRDAGTLTGRTPMWSATWHAADGTVRWIGAGWGSVWPHPWAPSPPNEVYDDLVARSLVLLTHGHNSFFDLLPELGLIGSLVFATVYLQALARGLERRRLRNEPTSESLEASRMVLLGVLALLVYGITEPITTIPLGWFVVVMLAADLTARRPGVRAASKHRGSEVGARRDQREAVTSESIAR